MKTLWRLGVVVMVLMAMVGVAHGQDQIGEPGYLQNPLNVSHGADPWLTYYEGFYYLTATTGQSHWTMQKSATLAGLKTAEKVTIYQETEPSRCCNFWAPEFHLLDGPNGKHWYFYYSAGQNGTLDFQHTHVLESAGTDPMGPYTYKARLQDPGRDTWMIDGTIVQLNEGLYFAFSAFDEGGLQSLYMAAMSDPWTLSSARVKISSPQLAWERVNGNVNEGPVLLQHDDKSYLVYSATGCWTGAYKLGMLTYQGGDPLKPASWQKYPEPIFQSADMNGVFGPGHNGFFKSPDGTEDWIVYHAVDFAAGACDDRRNTRVQKIEWNADGTPNLGVPVALGEVIAAPSGDMGVDPLAAYTNLPIVRIRSASYKVAYLRQVDYGLDVDINAGDITQGLFMIHPGLADANGISIESMTYRGYYVRHQNNQIILGAPDGSENFAGDATWYVRPGLADDSWQSFESFSKAGYYIGQQFGVVALVAYSDTMSKRMREDATFLQES